MESIVNSKEYWERRFSSGDWAAKGGRSQTALFAESQVKLFGLPRDFDGTILDFGCGLGDAIPVYRVCFPRARLIGVDISESAIKQCVERYGHLAEFRSGGVNDLPFVDVIVCSNVLEHLEDDIQTAAALHARCRQLFVTVPYKENPLCDEHVRAYDETRFGGVGHYEYRIFLSRGWSEFGMYLLRMWLKNAVLFLIRKPIRRRKMQIIFSFKPRALPIP